MDTFQHQSMLDLGTPLTPEEDQREKAYRKGYRQGVFEGMQKAADLVSQAGWMARCKKLAEDLRYASEVYKRKS